MLTAVMPDPFNYGRVTRDADGHVTGIVEDRDADERVKQIDEICTGVYAFGAGIARDALERIHADNAQGEEYLTDVVGLLVAEGKPVMSVVADDWQETLGVNDRVQLADARRIMRDRIVEHWMREGVTITDPRTTWMGVGVRLEPDVTIHQNTQLHGSTVIRTLLCPSDPHPKQYFGMASHNYAASRGPTAVFENPSCLCAHGWQSLAQSPMDDPRNFAAVKR